MSKQRPIPFRYEPHKGDFYKKGIGGDHYLIVGRSHHCLPSRRGKGLKYDCDKEFEDCLEKHEFDCPAFQKPCPLYEKICNSNKKSDFCKGTQEIKGRIRLSCETKYCIYDHVTNPDTTEINHVFQCFYDFGDRLKELGVLKEDVSRNLWHKVGFCNYIQKITTDRNNSPTALLDEDLKDDKYKEMFESSFQFFTPSPDVIVVLHYEKIKKIIATILSGFKSKEKGNFKEIKQLSKENVYYVFASQASELYKKYVYRLLNKYTPFINKNNYEGNVLLTAIAYHFTGGEWDKELIENIADELKEEYGLLSEGVNIKTINKSFNRLEKYLKKGSKDGGVWECYDSLISFLGK